MRCLCAALLLVLALTAQAEPLKILHVMSYRSDWQWNQEQLRGFVEGLASPGMQLKVVELDAKRADAAALHAAAQRASDLLRQWKPDLVYTTDDVAQAVFTVRHLNTATPIVYSGVNQDPRDHGFDRARNVTGVLEREHFKGTLALLRQLKPMARVRLAVVLDDGPTWLGVCSRNRQDLASMPEVQVLHWLQPRTFDEYKARMLALQDQVDAVALLGIFRFAKPDGSHADYEEVLRWTAEHSRLPDLAFWDTRVEQGTLCAVAVDGIEQGRLAGRMARRILLDKVAPSSIKPEATAKGRPMVSLARARQLGLAVDAGVLLGVTALPRYAWER